MLPWPKADDAGADGKDAGKIRKEMEKMISPYENLLDMYIAEKKEGFCRIGLSYRKEITNPHGNIHGGAIASVIDTAAVQGLRTIFSQGPYLTVEMNIRFRNSSCASEIFAESKPRHLRGKFFISDIRVVDKDNQLIAEAKVKSFLPAWEVRKREE